ncbi:carbohydrate esterase family 3 protein [Jackrogersella minutella]|nr:carbohydrate esterase family 3 protein [Jackrogersella minutella]
MLATKHLLWCVLACASQVVNGLAVPKTDALGIIAALARDNSDTSDAQAKGFGDGMPLRIMPLGASITYGYESTDGNGYRLDLRKQLEANGNEVNMVGDHPGGSMEDNDTEAWSGYVITQVHAKADVGAPKYKPNLVLVNVGTNDCVQNIDLAKAGDRMTSLLDDVYKDSPRATVVLSTLLANANATVQARVEDFNDQIRTVADRFRAAKRRLVLVDMQGTAGPRIADLNKDGTHPTDAGYARMANVWFAGIKEADREHFFQTAEKVAGIPDDGA